MNLTKFLSLILSLLLLLPTASFAVDDASLKQQRNTFLEAKKALAEHRLIQFRQLQSQLKDYPLQGYLDYLYLRPRLHLRDNQAVNKFLYENQNTFYAGRLRNAWLDQLAKNKQWSLFLKHYTLPQPASRQCLRLQALIATHQFEQALKEIPDLWLVNKSQHKNCDPAFTYWQDKGFLSDDMRGQRIQASLKNNQFNLASYLAKPLKNNIQVRKWIAHWKHMYSNPLAELEKLSNQPDLVKQDRLQFQELVLYGINRLARRSTDHAYAQWLKLQEQYQFDEHYRHDIQMAVATRAALNRQDRTLEFYGDLSDQPWRVRAALWQQDWPAVSKAINSLNPEEQSSSRWQYWLARAQEKLGQQEEAKHRLQHLIHERDYYSFLAADRLGEPYQMNHNPIAADLSELTQLSKHPEVVRLREFFALDMRLEARRQAYFLQQTLSTAELKLLALITHQWGWHNQTIAVLGKVKYWDDLSLRFPVVFDDLIVKAGKLHKLDPSWLLGVARQESAFNPQARSAVGAIGLMQLMPKTGQATAKLIKKPLRDVSELLKPSRNIQLGSAYLKQMYDKYQQNPVLATASYNAGPHRVARWLPKTKLPADIWIENIPYNETRHYTSNVLSYAAIFDYQRRQPITPISQRMPEIEAQSP